MKRSREPEETSPGEVADAAQGLAVAPDGDPDRPGEIDDVDGDTAPPATKIAELDLSDNRNGSDVLMHCSLPPHKEPLTFSSYSDYETHYRDQHTNRCVQCRKNFPSSHLLGLHIEEMHDSFVQARKERGERTYSCFVEGCDRKCSTPHKRKMHLIDKHMYPKDFFFAITREGIDGRNSLLREGRRHPRRRSSAAAASPPGSSQGQGLEPDAPGEPAKPRGGHTGADAAPKDAGQQRDQDMEHLSSAMAALQFVPMSVRFGRGKKAGFAKR
ncbi:1fb43af9-5bc9-41a2-bdf0-3b32e6f25ad7 [Thermothielavioides terrestris]|uniref:1fb43af9-5bc9-41a2-bdf0-3b32e6f25ad7 n=1 Tax=Thermothielavioides terrestris TaxID=2587410 RepID=A0A3S4C6Q5_9PEZI|nr:1fb43af9-5bc9-41a2-bdf0-3b32e6f25ad7 [Thermothielavioides terrestris]